MSRRLPLAGLALACWACASPDDLADRPPVADAGRDQRVVLRSERVYVRLDGSASHDPEGRTISWRWSVVRSPSSLFVGGATAGEKTPVVALRSPGLHVFALRVHDGRTESAPDYVNVWVVDGLGLDGGPPDAGEDDASGADAGPLDGEVPDAEALDAAPPPDAALADGAFPDGAPPDAAVEPDAAPPDPPDAAGEDTPPVPVIDVSEPRVPVGSTVRLSAARSRDDGQPAPLTYRWDLIGAPFGGRGGHVGEGVVVSYTPEHPGRHTFRLQVSDGASTVSTSVTLHAIGEVGYVLAPEDDHGWRFDLTNGGAQDPVIPMGDTDAAVGFEVRTGVLYAALPHTAERRAVLVVAAPGAPPLRRILPADNAPAAPVAAPGGVWIPMQGAPRLFLSDPLGLAPLETFALPPRWTHGLGLAVDGATAWLAEPIDPVGVLRLDLAERRLLSVASEDPAVCRPHTVAFDTDFIYVGCRNRNAVARMRRGHAGAISRDHTIPLQGAGARNFETIRVDDHLAIRHDSTEYVSLLPVSRFDLPPNSPDRERHRQLVLPVEGTVLDIAGRGRVLYVLSAPRGGGVVLTAFDAPRQLQLWQRRHPDRGGRFLAVDAADDLSRDLGDL